jgi:hypothetical protein
MKIQVMCVDARDKIAADEDSSGLYECEGDTLYDCLSDLALQDFPACTVRIEIDIMEED